MTTSKFNALIPALTACLLITACTEKPVEPVKITLPPKPVSQPRADAAVQPPSAPAEPPAAPVTVKELQSSADFADMNSLVEAFYDRNKRIPTLAELTRSYGRALPTPPAGHMFVIDAQAKKVKLVPVK